MKTLHFSCKLLTDIIVNQSASSQGPNATLDFIPGNNFLGIAAGRLYAGKEQSPDRLTTTESWLLFHSGKVRFGDAHPACGNERALRIPASFFYPKLGSMAQSCYIHHAIGQEQLEQLKKEQLKQCRSGFYNLGGETVHIVDTPTTFAIKSAYDPLTRRSMDEKMFGYESLAQGLNLFFDVEIDDEALPYERQLIDALSGIRRIGRSKNAQFGQVEINCLESAYTQPSSTTELSRYDNQNYLVVYADGRLIFLDDDGLPTLSPTPQQLGIEDDPTAHIVWEKSQVRTFQYAPWNYKRQCFDTDRHGFEKGSVIVIATSLSSIPQLPNYIGSFCNEGFGKVIYNPAFLQHDQDARTILHLSTDGDSEPDTPANDHQLLAADLPLLAILRSKKQDIDQEKQIYKMVNDWIFGNKEAKVKAHLDLFRGGKFPSQWGTIRSIAMSCHSVSEVKENIIQRYLKHGVAAKKWEDKSRLASFIEFVDNLNDNNAQKAIINLAAEMAKACK